MSARHSQDVYISGRNSLYSFFVERNQHNIHLKNKSRLELSEIPLAQATSMVQEPPKQPFPTFPHAKAKTLTGLTVHRSEKCASPQP